MSHIFDALQVSEAESSGAETPLQLEATELLKRAERRANSQWEAEASPELREKRAFQPMETRPAMQAEFPPAAKVAEKAPVQEGDRAEPFPQFQSIEISLTQGNRLTCLTDPESHASEAFRLLGVRLRHLRRERSLKRILITSSIPKEGKSMVAANLACTMALAAKQRTLLVEGDVRRPSLTQMFGLQQKPGLCDWLRGERRPMTSIYKLEGSGFWILPAGSASGNPLELLQSKRLSTLMDQLAGWFDWIVIDSPPVLPLADTSVWARSADGILLVARRGTTEKRQLQRALEALEPKKLIGALLNSSETAAESSYYYTPTESRPIDTST